MSIQTIISIFSALVALTAFILSRRDKQSEKTRAELDDLQKRIARDEDEINDLQQQVVQLQQENETLRNENIRLMRSLMNCPTDNCPVIPKPQQGDWTGPERRKKPRVKAGLE